MGAGHEARSNGLMLDLALRIRNMGGMGIRDEIIKAAGNAGFDYKKLAELSGLPRATVHRYLHGKNDLTGNRIDKLLEALRLGIGHRRNRPRKPLQTKPLFLEVSKTNKPIIRYPGSKWRLMPDIIRLLPSHEHYVSVFGGSASDILRKPASMLETFNDIDNDVSGLFSLLQDEKKRESLLDLLAYTPAQCQDQFEKAVDILHGTETDAIKRAWAFLVVSFQGLCVASPRQQDARRWRYARKPHSTLKNWDTLPDAVQAAAERFKSVQITCWQWSRVIEKTDSAQTVLFLDPPYIRETLPKRYYQHTMSIEEHGDLLKRLQSVKGYVILCGYQSALYNDALNGWRLVEINTQASTGLSSRKSTRTECLWLNFDEAGHRLPM